MGVYVITDGDGTYIRKDKGTGKYVTIKGIKYADQWDSIVKASAVLTNLISKSIRSLFAVQLIETKETIDKRQSSAVVGLLNKNVSDDNITDWMHKVESIAEIMSGSDTRKTELSDRLGEVDKQIIDIEHYIEFGKFNAYQGWQCFKMLQNALLQRRKYKNEISVIQMISDCKIDKGSVIALKNLISDIENKTYHPRALPDLFMRG